MDIPYFYEEKITQPQNILSEVTSKHCVQVLRMKDGERLQLTDGKGILFTAIITYAHKSHCEISIQSSELKPRTGENISIAISLLKNPSRLEWFMEKATEIGVAEIIPLICDHTEKESFRFDRMQNVLVSAMLQSQQTWLPQLHQPKFFDAFINESFDGTKFIAHCEKEQKQTLAEVFNQNENKLILIGPEGDFSKAEIEMALQKNFIPVTLGNTRLRTETAGIIAAAMLKNAVHQA